MTEFRKAPLRAVASVRAAGGKPGVTLHAIVPNVVDDYGSLWSPNAFDASLAKRLPTLCWSHDWAEPLGPGVGFRVGPNGPEIDFVFSDFDAVPMARRAHAQVEDGTIGDCSVGFSAAVKRAPTSDELRQFPGVVEYIESADLDEVSLVLRGAVPGAKVLSVRQRVRDAILAVKRSGGSDAAAQRAARAVIIGEQREPSVEDMIQNALDLIATRGGWGDSNLADRAVRAGGIVDELAAARSKAEEREPTPRVRRWAWADTGSYSQLPIKR